MPLEERFQLCRSVAEECVQDDDLMALLKARASPVAYDGFEPSGRMHIAQGVMKALNVNKLTKAGCTFKFWVADWFAQLNNKVGATARRTSRYYASPHPMSAGLRSRCCHPQHVIES